MKTEVKLFMVKENGHTGFMIKDKTGVERFISIFNGGGYYTDFMIETQKQINENNKRQKQIEKEEDKRIEKRLQEQKKSWWQFWK